jgi:hypothetical protein
MKGARSLQPGTSKTRTHTSITAMRRSLLDRKTSTVAWQHREKTPSSPPNPMPSTMSRVSRNGTVSGTDSNLPCSKHIPKSMGISSVVFVSTKILYECRSPRPTMYPTIELTATLRVYLRDYQQGSIDFNALISVSCRWFHSYFSRELNHSAGSGDISRNTRLITGWKLPVTCKVDTVLKLRSCHP